MYAAYPQQWLSRAALPAFGNSSLSGFASFGNQQGFIFFSAFFTLVKSLFPFINTQALSYGIALASGFIGTYCVVLQITHENNGVERRFIGSIAGISYATCPLIATYYWSSPYAWIIGIDGVPLLVSIAIAYARSGWVWWMVAYSLCIAFFGVGLQAFPVSIAYTFALATIAFAYLCLGSKTLTHRSLLFSRMLVTIVATVCTSAFWIIPLGFSIIIPGGFGRGAIEGVAGAADIVRSVARGQSIIDTLLLLPSPEFLRIWNWPQLAIWNTWYVYLVFPSFILIVIILTGFIICRVGERMRSTLIISTAMLVLLAYLQTVNISSLGVDVFSAVIGKAIGMGMYRDFFNKFTGTYVFIYVTVLSISLIVVLHNVPLLPRLTINILATLVILAQSLPMLEGAPLLLPVSGSSLSSTGRFPSSYLQAMNYLSQRPDFGRILELPLSTQLFGSIIPLDKSSSIYRGISPVKVLSGKQTMNSYYSFATGGSVQLDKHLSEAIHDDDLVALRNVLRLSGVKYIVYNAGYPEEALQWLQQPVFPRDDSAMRTLADRLGAQEVARFATTTTSTDVFALPDSSVLPLIFVEDDDRIAANAGADDVRKWMPPDALVALRPDADAVKIVRRVSAWEYKVTLDLTRPSTLILLEPSDAGWVATETSKGLRGGRSLVKSRVDGYASGWAVPDTGSVTVDLVYRPQRIIWLGLGVTIGFVLLAVLWAALQTVRDRGLRDTSRHADGPSDRAASRQAFEGNRDVR